MKPKYKDRLWKHIHDSAKFFHEIGVMSEERLRECEKACTIPETSGATPSVSTPAPAYAESGEAGGRLRTKKAPGSHGPGCVL